MRGRVLIGVILLLASGCSSGRFQQVDVVRFFHTDLTFPTDEEVTAAHGGQAVVLSFKTDPAAINAGTNDAALRQAEATMGTAEGTWYVGYWHEPEGEMDPAVYRAAFSHVAALMHDVSNVQTIMILSATTYASGRSADWYAGDDAVDAIGADGYDWRGCRTNGGVAEPGSASRGFGQIFEAADAFARSKDKPIIAGEFGTAADPTGPGSRITWLRNAAAWLADHPEFIGGWYFNHGTAGGFRCNWALDAHGNELATALWAAPR